VSCRKQVESVTEPWVVDVPSNSADGMVERVAGVGGTVELEIGVAEGFMTDHDQCGVSKAAQNLG